MSAEQQRLLLQQAQLAALSNISANLPQGTTLQHVLAASVAPEVEQPDSNARALKAFWEEQVREIQEIPMNRPHELPLARIKKIMKSDEDVKMIKPEVLELFERACEMFIREVTLLAWQRRSSQKTLKRADIAAAVSQNEAYDFLIDIVPRSDSVPKSRSHEHGASSASLPYMGSLQIPGSSLLNSPAFGQTSGSPSALTSALLAMSPEQQQAVLSTLTAQQQQQHQQQQQMLPGQQRQKQQQQLALAQQLLSSAAANPALRAALSQQFPNAAPQLSAPTLNVDINLLQGLLGTTSQSMQTTTVSGASARQSAQNTGPTAVSSTTTAQLNSPQVQFMNNLLRQQQAQPSSGSTHILHTGAQHQHSAQSFEQHSAVTGQHQSLSQHLPQNMLQNQRHQLELPQTAPPQVHSLNDIDFMPEMFDQHEFN